ncbi:MAG: hypothetical protein ACO1SV_21655 [Fimbriimonas sp.]
MNEPWQDALRRELDRLESPEQSGAFSQALAEGLADFEAHLKAQGCHCGYALEGLDIRVSVALPNETLCRIEITADELTRRMLADLGWDGPVNAREGELLRKRDVKAAVAAVLGRELVAQIWQIK